MATYRLHYFPESGNSYKLALMLTLCGQTFEPVWTDFGGGVTRTPEWRRTVNAMGEIPVLEEMGRAPHPDRADPAETRRSNHRPDWAATPPRKNSNIALAVLGQPQTDRLHGDLSVSSDVHAVARSRILAHYRKRLDDFLGILEQHLQRSAFAIGDQPTVADLSMIADPSYPGDETGYDLAVSHPVVSAWLGRVAGLPGWRSAYDLLPGKRLTHYA